MGTKHRHYDVIVAWAAGEEIEFKRPGHLWQYAGQRPTWEADNEYRIKPKIVKKEGWVNVYKATQPNHIGIAHISNAYATNEEALADRRYDIDPTDTIRIEWEEEE